MLKLEYSATLGKVIRMDDITTIGISSQTMAERAIAEGRHEEAAEVSKYFFQELHMMGGVLITWLRDILQHLLEQGQYDQPALAAATLLRTFEVYDPGSPMLPRIEAAILAGRTDEAVRELNLMRQEYRAVHDLMVTWIQDLLTFMADRYGESSVRESITRTNDNIWAVRFKRWSEMSVWEKVAFTCEGMRAHLSGPTRRGDVFIREEDDRYVFAFDPCGSAGVLRRGDPETGRGPHPTEGLNRQAHDWTWGKTGVLWYCSHCPIAMEWLPGTRTGHPMRPLDHSLDPVMPSIWYVYKDEAATRAEHYERVGLPVPRTAPQVPTKSGLPSEWTPSDIYRKHAEPES